MLHNAHNELVAEVGLVLSVVPDGYPLDPFVSHLDQTNDNDIQELSLAVVDAVVDDGELSDREWERLLLVRDWEVREQERGQGLWRRLLQSAWKKAFKGIPWPNVVAAKLWPLQLLPTCRQASPTIPEIREPRTHLKNFWEKKVIKGGILPKSVTASIDVGHYAMMHTSGAKMEMVALGGARMKAREYEDSLYED